MSNPEQINRRMNALEERVESHDTMLRGDSETEGLMSNVRQLVKESKRREYIQTAILICVVSLLIERAFRILG